MDNEKTIGQMCLEKQMKNKKTRLKNKLASLVACAFVEGQLDREFIVARAQNLGYEYVNEIRESRDLYKSKVMEEVKAIWNEFGK